MRDIKFRVWDNVDYMSSIFTLQDLQDKKIEFTSDCKVMQFTGLKDKNGKEIYEGDIILFQTFSNWDDDSMRRHIATVIFKEGCFMWKILEYGKKSNFYRANETEPLRNTNCTWGLEIIGNIHENPELLSNE